jgi:CRISPR-associated endonuclease/helicase Cas3
MKTEMTVFPAHYRIADDTVQTVEEHSEGVKTKCEKYAKKLHFRNIGIILGLLHDLGKFTDEFYDYITEAIKREKEKKPKLNSSVDHGKYGALLALEHYHNGSVYRKILSEIIAMTVCYHHGGMEDYISDNLEIKLLNRCGWSDTAEKTDDTKKANVEADNTDKAYTQACERFFERVISPEQLDELFEKAAAELQEYMDSQKEAGLLSPFHIHLLIKFLYSCLIDADRYDTYLFMQNKEEEEDVDIKLLWKEFSEKLAIKEDSFQKQKAGSKLGETIRILRNDIWQQCRDFSSRPTGIYTLTVPTGGGKTLSSLRYALDHAMLSGKKRILYVLPFTAIIEQNAAVIREVLKAGDYLLEHHSNVANEAEYGTDEFEYRQLLTEQWTSPIIFTTMVQFLNTFFAGGTQDIRRFHNLTDTIIIFDEIQALPVKCISLFNETANFLSNQCRDTIILCSATQPNLDKVGHKINIRQEIIKDLKGKFDDFKRMEIIDARYRRKMSIPELGEFIRDLKKENETILIILNTKKAAEAVYKEVKFQLANNGIIFCFLSTNLCPAHRKEIIKELKKALNDHKQVICVSTQLIEAGVDISFSCVIRHVAGLDSIAQASGRGNRNGEGSIKNTYIIQLEDERLGSLEEIELGEKCSGFVLDEYARNRDRFDNNLLSPKSISCYYDYFFKEEDIEKKMDYPVTEKKNTIFDMLSRPNKKTAYKNVNNRKSPLELEFQFKTAAKNFEVIDEAAKSVLVPYGEGKNIISKLLSQGGPLPDMKLIRSAQSYMVNVSMNVYEMLKKNHAVCMDERSGVLILRDVFYDEELGVVPEGGKMETLMMGN